MPYIFIIALLLCQACLGQTPEFAGVWKGELKFGGNSLPFIIHVEQDLEGLSAHAESPNQGVKNIPTKVQVNGDSIHFDIKGGILVRGKLLDGKIDALFIQSGIKIPFVMYRVQVDDQAKSNVKVRSQEPIKPYPYDTLAVRIPNKIDGIDLAGTITFPKGEGKYPAVILVSGSGPQDRDESLFGHKPFKVLADYLTKKGIIVLRYDDRGVGNSSGNFENSTIEHFSKDAVAAFQYLRGFEKVDVNKLGIIGHSEGGLIAYLLAGQALPNLSFIASLAGPAISIDQLMVEQLYAIGKASGMNQIQLEQARRINEKNFAIVKSNLSTEKAYESLVYNMGLTMDGQQMDAMKGELMTMLSPAYRYFLRIEPEHFLPKIYIPVFAAFGQLDVQVPPATNMSSLQQLLAPNSKTNIKEYKGLNHLFQRAETGLVQEYMDIEHTIDDAFMAKLSSWINNL